jgi:hypothetical protein
MSDAYRDAEYSVIPDLPMALMCSVNHPAELLKLVICRLQKDVTHLFA